MDITTKKIPAFPEFAKLEFIHLDEVKEALALHPPEVTTIGSANIFCYRQQARLMVTRINGNICINGFYRHLHFISQPIGTSKLKDTVNTALLFLKEKHGVGRVYNIPKSLVEVLQDDKRFMITPDRDSFEYLYDAKELAELPGEKFHDKKNLLNQFKAKYKYEYKPLSAGLIKQCLDLEEQWCRLRNCMETESTAAESVCIREMLMNFDRLELFGGVIEIDGRIEAFTIMQKLNSDTAVTHIEKANTHFKGIYQAINCFAAESVFRRFKYINREEDLGFAGLRKAKLSYNPVRLIEKYHVEFSI